jgi:octaprenyl-diphosphate synthase
MLANGASRVVVMEADGAEVGTARAVGCARRLAEPPPDGVKVRLQQIRDLYGEDMAVVESGLSRLVREGLSPGTDAAAHLLDAGGKRVRPLTVILSAACFGEPGRTVRDVAMVAELIHLATLLHDDVIDAGTERRGQPTSRRIWGNAVSVLSGDMLLTLALERTASVAPSGVLVDLLATLRRLVAGEILQLAGRGTLAHGEANYFRIIRDKTGSLFEWAARSGAACVGASSDACGALAEFGAHVGIAFQLIDDVLDYSGDPRAIGKALLGDLADGKLTLPLIRALAAVPALRIDVDAARSGDGDACLRVADVVRSSGVCDGVRALAREHSAQALAPLQTLPPSVARDLLGAIAEELSLRAS